MTLVVDASITVKWLVDEPGRASARDLLDQVEPLQAPDFVLVETANVLWKKVRRREITREQATIGIETLPQLFESLLASAGLIRRALDLAIEIDHPIYDCLYLAGAESIDAALVTADERLLRKAQGAASHLRVYALPRSAGSPT